MIKELIHDPLFLAQKSEPATSDDLQVVTDLIDTLAAHREECAGMAANMIGVKKNIIAVNAGMMLIPMINPVIKKKEGPYAAEEGCLSLLGGPRKTTRYKTIEVEFQDPSFKKSVSTFTGWTAQIIQHEIDHCNGILI